MFVLHVSCLGAICPICAKCPLRLSENDGSGALALSLAIDVLCRLYYHKFAKMGYYPIFSA